VKMPLRGAPCLIWRTLSPVVDQSTARDGQIGVKEFDVDLSGLPDVLREQKQSWTPPIPTG
jgi:hypothetical protein